MTTTRWTLTINNQLHTIRLEHGYWSGKREIYVDEKQVERNRMLYDSGSIHCLDIDRQPIHLYITTNGITFNYLLTKGLEIIPSDHDLRAGRSAEKLLNSKHFWDLLIWRELSKRLELPYSIDTKMPWPYRHRLIGMFGGYLVKITPGQLAQSLKNGFEVLIHYAPLKRPEQIELIANDDRIPALLGQLNKQLKEIFSVQEKFASIFLPFERNETPADIAQKIQQFIAVVSRYAPRLEEDCCDSPDCRSHGTSPIQLVLFNRLPYFLCQDCIDQLPERVRQGEEEFRQAPNNLLPGLLAGVSASILGAVLMVGFALFLTPFVWPFSLIIMPAIVYLMHKVEVKVSWKMLLMSAGLAVLSIVLGYIFTALLFMIRAGYPITITTFIQSGQNLLQDTGIKSTFFLTGLVIALYFYCQWITMRNKLRASFNLQVEILSPDPSAQTAIK